MKPRLKILGSNGSNFTLTLHAQLHTSLFDIVNKSRAKIQMMNDMLMAEWRQHIDMEITLTRKIRKCIETAEMHKKDRERNYYAKYLFSIIRLESESPDETRRMAGRRLLLVIEPQKRVYRASVMEKDVLICMLVSNLLDEEENKKCVDLLGLNPVIDKLVEANDAYEKAYSERMKTRVTKKTQHSRVVRRETDKCYNMVCEIIDLNYYLNGIGADKEEIRMLIHNMNEVIKLEKTTFKQIQSHKKDDDIEPPESENESDENVQTSHRGVSNSTTSNTAQIKSSESEMESDDAWGETPRGDVSTNAIKNTAQIE